ncbi:zinc knuckle CX2CX4HX4C containing protein [Tanacetum coccineum]
MLRTCGVDLNGPWLIRNVPLILRKWSPLANVAKEDLKSVPVWVKLRDDRLSAMCMESWGWSSFARAMIDIHVPVWVKLHDVPITAFTEDRLSAMCMESWRRSRFARAMIDIHADVELKDTLVVAVPKLKVFGHSLEKCSKKTVYDVNVKTQRQVVRGPNCSNYKTTTAKKMDNRHAKQKDTNSNKVSGNYNSGSKSVVDVANSSGNCKDDNLDNEDNDSENDVEEDDNESARKKSLYEHWKDDYNDNPYDDDKECEDLMEEQLALVSVVKFGSNVL